MDALTKLNEHFLSCNICTETFKDPCILGCYHTFCRPCLTKYTKTRRDAITAKSILCPNCNQMTKVPRPKEPVDRVVNYIHPLDDCCFTCEHTGKTTQATSVCEDCDTKFCEACAKIHLSSPRRSDHVISPLSAESTPQLKKRKVMCPEHNCLVEFCCRDCQKAVCHTCCIVYHRKCHSDVTLDAMIPEMKQVLQQNYDDIELYLQQTGNTLKSRKSEVEEITQHKSSLQSEIRRVSQQAVDLIRRKETKLLDEVETLTKKQTEELRSQIKSGEIDTQTYQQYTEFFRQVLQSNSSMDIYDMYTLCQSGEITAEIHRKDKQEQRTKKVVFEKQLDVDNLDRSLQLGNLRFVEDTSNLEVRPSLKYALKTKPTVKSEPNPGQLLLTVNAKLNDDEYQPNFCDVEAFNIRGTCTETLVVTDNRNSSVKSCYTKDKTSHCTSLKLNQRPLTLTKISKDRVAVSYWSHNSIELIKLTPDPVLISTIKTKKEYRSLTALSDTTLAVVCRDPPSIDVLDLSGRVLRSVITPKTGQQLIQIPWYMCTTRQGHIVVADWRSNSVYCVTQQGEIIYQYKLAGRYGTGGVTTTDTGSVIVAYNNGNKIVQLTETGQYVRDLLTRQDGIDSPQGNCMLQKRTVNISKYFNCEPMIRSKQCIFSMPISMS